MSKQIPLGNSGLFANIDDKDFESISLHRWYAARRGGRIYAKRQWKDSNGTQHIQLMHNLIMNTKGIDHIDHNGLNNQRNNLRVATPQQNNANAALSRNNTSGYKGVQWYKAYGKWRAQLRYNYKPLHLGYFDSKEEARIAYITAAKRIFGEFACAD